jgi:hypothetical protein
VVAAAAAERLGAASARLRGLWDRRPAPGRLGAFAFAALLFLAGAGGLGFQLALRAILPSPIDWEAAALVLERDARRGDALVTSPAWAERIRQIAPRGLTVLTAPRLTPAALQGVRRVWLLSLPGAPGFSWQPELDLLARSAAPEPPLPVGKLRLARFELSHPDLPLAALEERLAGGSVSLGNRPCAANGAGFRCDAGQGKATLTRGVVEVNGVPRPCLLARLSGEPAPLRVTIPGVPVGRTLRGGAGLGGLAGPGAQEAGKLAVAVRVDGEEAATVQLEASGWSSFQVDTARWAGERHAVSLEVAAPGDHALCLQAVTLP